MIVQEPYKLNIVYTAKAGVVTQNLPYANPFGGDTGSPVEGTWMRL